MKYRVYSAEETEALGRKIAAALSSGDKKNRFIALRGEMGVGKTAFTRGFASHFGITGVKSPTYTVVNEYRKADTVIYHFDMYRIENEDDLYSIGYDDYIASDGYCLAEWSENVEDLLPYERITVEICRCPEGEDIRDIEVFGPNGTEVIL